MGEREARQNMLTNEEKEIVIEQAKLEREKNRQAKLEKRQKQQEYQNILYRQYRAQILRRAHEIERELEEDLAMLENVKHETEKEQQHEIEYLYREQAAQYWEKREAEWEKERKSRARLLESVLSDRQKQLTERLDRIQERKQENIRDRQRMLEDIERKKDDMKYQVETDRARRIDFINGIQQQIDEKHDRIIAHIDIENKENEEVAATAREIENLE